jgi:cation diffusion facilitator family transporter
MTPRTRKIRQVLWGILALNLVVSFAKTTWGFISGSVAMQADGFHSLFDGASNVIGLIGVYLAARPADADHPYGHGKYETYASAAIGAILALVAFDVGRNAVRELMAVSEEPVVSFTSFAIMVMTLGIVNSEHLPPARSPRSPTIASRLYRVLGFGVESSGAGGRERDPIGGRAPV